MKKIISLAFVALFAASLFTGCANYPSTTDYDAEQTYINAWITVNYPTAQKTGRGIYVLEDTPGTGAEVTDKVLDGQYVFIQYTSFNADGDIVETYYEDVAKRIGEYANTKYYGPIALGTKKGMIYAGVRDLLKGMKVGGTRKALIPSWLHSYNDYSKEEKYLSEKSSASTSVYEITLTDITEDIEKWEVAQVEKFVAETMGGIDSLQYGLYYKTLVPAVDTTSFNKDTTVYVNYVGRLLNGLIFDTNVADSAKTYDIYKAGATYTPAEVKFSKPEEATSSDQEDNTITMDGSSTIKGFSYALSKMKSFEKGRVVFISNLGYGGNGSGSSIPGYSPLIFDLEIVDKPDSDE